MKELVSIITTLYNYADYIEDLIRSCEAQTYRNWELIIVDDGSTDNPYSKIKPYLVSQHIRYIRFDENRWYSFAKNEGIVLAIGEYIVMIDADDMLTPKSLELRYDLLKANPKNLWCHGDVLVLSSGKRVAPPRPRKRPELNDVYQNYRRKIHAQSVMVRKELHQKVGLYDEDLPFSADKEMWERILGLGYIPAYINAAVAIYRSHQRQMHRQTYKRLNLHIYKPMRIRNTQRRIADGINSNNTRLLQ